jgi:pyruvate formate lyase activating enzyme
LHFTAFHPDYKMLDLPRTPAFTLTTARDIARKVGLHFVYTGNVHDERGQSTYCPGCSERIIGRDWYDITTWRLTENGRCGICSTAIPGLFEAHPGNLGAAARPDPDRQTGMLVNENDGDVEAPHCCVLEREPD